MAGISHNTKKNPLISVIIPVYNTEKYLSECIESVVKQTYSNLEIIIIDDGSTDSSGEICDRFASKDERITVIHKDNQGRSKARNDGLDLMKGDFFSFVDADDLIAENAMELLVNQIEPGTEIILARIKSFYPDKEEPYEPETGTGRSISQDELLEFFALDNMHWNTGNYEINGAPYARLYSCGLKHIRFPEDLSYAEDYLYSMKVFLECRKIRYLDSIVYSYRRFFEEEKHFWEDFRKLSLEGTEARMRAIDLVKHNNEGLYQDYALRSYYSILDTYCSCIKLGYSDSADKIATELDSIKDGVKRGESIRKLGLFQRLKLSLSFMSYRLYALLYLFRRRKEVQWKMSR